MSRTKQSIITEALRESSNNPRAAYRAVAPLVGIDPMEFTRNHDGGRIPRELGAEVDPDARSTDPTGARKPHALRTQHEMCLRMCYAVALHGRGRRPRPDDSAETPAPAPEPAAEPTPTEPPAPTPAPEPEPGTIRAEVERYRRELARLRAFVTARGDFDSLESMRNANDGVKAIIAGVPVDGLLAAIVAGWNAESRNQSRIAPFDYAAWGRRQPEYDPAYHAAMPYVLRLVKAGVLVYLHGPAGTGKSTIAEGVAKALGREYREVNLAGAMASAIKGKVTPEGVKTDTAFRMSYTSSSVLGLEELDATHPNVGTALNNALANGHFANDVDNVTYVRHEEFALVATGNTLGNGATKQYAGRMNLDGATKDRFRIGRVEIRNDAELEDRIVENLLVKAGL